MSFMRESPVLRADAVPTLERLANASLRLATPGAPFQDIPECAGMSWNGEHVAALSVVPGLLGAC